MEEKEYIIYLEDFCEEIFYKMEKIQDGKSGHVVMFSGKNKDEVVEKIISRLKPFLLESLEEKEEDDQEGGETD